LNIKLFYNYVCFVWFCFLFSLFYICKFCFAYSIHFLYSLYKQNKYKTITRFVIVRLDKHLIKYYATSFLEMNKRQINVFYSMTNNNFYFLDAISSASITCPDYLLGRFSYTYDAGSGNTCTSSSNLDVCTDNTLMTFNYTACSTPQGYSSKYYSFSIMIIKAFGLLRDLLLKQERLERQLIPLLLVMCFVVYS